MNNAAIERENMFILNKNGAKMDVNRIQYKHERLMIRTDKLS